MEAVSGRTPSLSAWGTLPVTENICSTAQIKSPSQHSTVSRWCRLREVTSRSFPRLAR